MRIGYRDADRQITYPDADNLSVTAQPIHMHQDLRSVATHRHRSHPPSRPPPPDLRAAPAARPPCGARPTRPHTSCRPRLLCAPVGGGPPAAALCAGGRRPAREIATRELRSECSISRPALALPPPTGTAATSTQQASRHPPVGRPPTPQRQSPQATRPSSSGSSACSCNTDNRG